MRRKIDYVLEPCILCNGKGKSTGDPIKIDLPCVHCRGLGMEYLQKKNGIQELVKIKVVKTLYIVMLFLPLERFQ